MDGARIKTPLTVSLPDDLMTKLEELAAKHKVAPEELVRLSVEELVASPEETFDNIATYVLNKNEKLYKRLAA
jgi:predicted transcriptional regulator